MLLVTAPLAGAVVALGDVPDPVFAEELVGPGLAVLPPESSGPTTAAAPVAGTVAAVAPHAVVVQVEHDRSVLVHLGVDTVALRGEGFTVHVVLGDRVDVGQPLVTWDVAAVAAGGRSVACPVVALQAPAGQVMPRAVAGSVVEAGDVLFTWSDGRSSGR